MVKISLRSVRYSGGEDDDSHEEIGSSTGSCFYINENSGDNLKRKRSAESDDEICSQKPKTNRRLYDDGSEYTEAEPLIRCAWTGDFNVWYDESIYPRRVYSFNAFLSSKACRKVHDAAAMLDPMMCFEILPNYCIWPERFGRSGPTGDDIGLYFFPPSKEHEGLYDLLIAEMISYDLGMRTLEQDKSELLIFTSVELPLPIRRYQGKYYLWGVFKGKKSPALK